MNRAESNGLNIVILGLTISSSWGNGHATTFRALVKGLATRGHRITFLERDLPWYREHRDLADFPFCETRFYQSLRELFEQFERDILCADLVILGSYVPDGATIGGWITSHVCGVAAFYDIDTPVTLAALAEGKADYISASLIPRFDLYLSFTGGPVLDFIERHHGSPRARALYCAVDPELHRPLDVPSRWSLGYLGTFSASRQPALERLLIAPARRLSDHPMIVAGAQYPNEIDWPVNVERIEHLPPDSHRSFYCAQRYTLNLTRAEMVSAGYSPSVRLFEAAACGVPIISDAWPGLETILVHDLEILIAESPDHVVDIVGNLPEDRRRDIAEAARRRVLGDHTGTHRAKELEGYYREVIESRRSKRRINAVA